jgi:acyl-CoA thioesterase YciA
MGGSEFLKLAVFWKRRTPAFSYQCMNPVYETKGALAIRVSMLPRDTNPGGTIFGGVILAHLDQAGGIEARKHADKLFVTVAMRGIEFIAPVFVGDIVSFYTRTLKVGTTSVTVAIVVEAQRYHDGDDIVRVMEAEAVYVAVDGVTRKPIAIKD